jgi:XTP/dITP diphosphohydrolase
LKIYFVTTSPFKINELKGYVERNDVPSRFGVEFCMVDHPLEELLLLDIEAIVKHKALKAYEFLGLPCVVEHGGLVVDAWQSGVAGSPGLLGGIGHVVWNAVGARMCGFLRSEDSRGAVAESVVGYCDGRRVRTYRGQSRGTITENARGEYNFHWDPIFVPDGHEQTHGEMGPELKRATSPTLKAWEAFLTAEFPERGARARRDVAFRRRP